MIFKIKSLVSTDIKKKLLTNFFSLSTLQAVNYLLPLATLPYLVKVLGLDKFGLIMFAQAFMIYFSVLVDYGFNLTGTRQISLHKNNLKRLNKIFNSILLTKVLLFIIGFFVLSIVVISINKFSAEWELYFLTYMGIFGMAIFPTWFFQGMEKLKYITGVTVMIKIIFTFFIFIFISKTEDYIYVPLINSAGSIFSGIIAIYIAIIKFEIKLRLQKPKFIIYQIRKGWYIFVSKISTSLYIATNTFLLGVFTSNIIVSYYVVAEKIIRLIAYAFIPISQAIYPHVVILFRKSKSEGFQFLIKILQVILFITFILAVMIYVYSPYLINIVFDINSQVPVQILRIFTPLILLIPISSIVFQVAFTALKKDITLSKLTIISIFFNLFLVFILFLIFESDKYIYCIAYSLLCTEAILTFLGFLILYSSFKEKTNC